MSENSSASIATERQGNLEGQLRNIGQLEQRIQDLQLSLQQMAKVESHENKVINNLYSVSLKTARNKLNFVESHNFIRKRHQNLSKEVIKKSEKVKEMRQKEQAELQKVKQMMKRNKENEFMDVKRNSLRHDATIRKNKLSNREDKQNKVKEIRYHRQILRQSIADSRVEESKQKQRLKMNQTLAKIERQPQLEKQLDKLLKKKEEMEEKIQQKKRNQEKIKEQIEKIKRMDYQQASRIIEQTEQEKKKHQLSPLKSRVKDSKEELYGTKSMFRSHLLGDNSVWIIQ